MTSPRPQIVVLDDEPNMGKALGKHFALEGWESRAFTAPFDALTYLRNHRVDVLLSDLRMPGLSGEEVLERLRADGCDAQVILITAYGTVESAMRCVKQGAFDYVTKPFDTKALIETVRRAIATRQDAPRQAAAPPPDADELVGSSPEMQAARDMLRRVAQTDSAVLITGESGTGKELAARAIHRMSARAKKPCIAVNCASIPETLIESELFGHERGAFTGADQARAGLMEAAEGGTLFLDEIGELPLAMQSKLLRALQEKEITRIGSVKSTPIDIRIVAATNRKLEAEVAAGRFRQDLFYRLNVLIVKMPALRKRPGDILPIAEHFLAGFRASLRRPGLAFSPELQAYMAAQPWPGNVRELRNFVERLAVLADGDVLGTGLLKAATGSDSQIAPAINPAEAAARANGPLPEFKEARDQFEADYLKAVLRAAEGNVSEAAKRSGMSRRNFYEKIEKLGINLEDFK